MISILNILLSSSFFVGVVCQEITEYNEDNLNRYTVPSTEWPGRWFPDTQRTFPEEINHQKHVAEMATVDNKYCDNGKTNLTIDFPIDEYNFNCPSNFFEPDYTLPSVLTKYLIPKQYMPMHQCMNTSIEYPFRIPTYGDHRPVWAKWGEYKYIPPQRWIHNLEHGGVVMLYDPCAHKLMVNLLRKVMNSCLHNYIITPFQLGPERPLALVGWGVSLEMSVADLQNAKAFIQEHAGNGPEKLTEDGKYDLLFRQKSPYPIAKPPGIC